MISGAGSETFGGLPVTSNMVSGENEDIPSNQVDYLKVRAYLYKFTPEVLFGGKSGQRDFSQATVDRSSTQDLINQANNLKVVIRALLDDLRLVNFDQDYNDFIGDQKTIKASGSLGAFLSLPTLSADNKLIIYNSFRNIKTDKVANIQFMDMSQIYDITVNLYNYLNGGLGSLGAPPLGFAGQRNKLKATRQSLLEFLGSVTFKIDSVIKSQQGAIRKLQSDLASEQSDLKQFQVNRFVYDLNTKDLSRFDLSRYLSQYQVDQQLGMLSPGTINASAVLQNAIIPLVDLLVIQSPRAVRRPWFFPDKNGDYAGYVKGVPGNTVTADSLNFGATLDPISLEAVSTLSSDELLTRIAMAQTLEDNGGDEKTKGSSAYERDVLRVEIAMRLRGIYSNRMRELITKYFRSGLVDDELVKRASVIKAPKSFANNVATAELAQGNVTPLGLSSGLNDSQLNIAKELNGILPGELEKQLNVLKSLLTDPKVDGIQVSDLVQKYDFFSIFVYKHDVSPDIIEETLEAVTTDAFFFDKESLFMYTPSAFLLNKEDVTRRHFATYSPEFNGFVLTTTSAIATGAVNSLTLNLMGSMGLMGATKRIYNGTIFQDSVFDAAELSDERIFNLYQNLYQNKDPFQILTTLLDSLYLLRVAIPDKDITLSPEDIQRINNEVDTGIINAPSVTFTPDRIKQIKDSKIKAAEVEAKRVRTQGGKSDYIRDGDGNVSSFLDILSLRAFNQFREKDRKDVLKGPKHLFNMASYLYANVMRSRRFNVRVATYDQVSQLGNKYGGNGSGSKKPFDLVKQTKGFTINGAFDPYSTNKENLILNNKETDGSGGSILETNPSLSASSTLNLYEKAANPVVTKEEARAWKAYFLFLSQSFGDFVADVKSGLDIMNDVTNSCYLELYETPGGRFVFRTPQYNNNIPIYRTLSQDGRVRQKSDSQLVTEEDGNVTYVSTAYAESSFAHMLTSEDIIPISAEYRQTAQNLVTKQQMGYGADLIGQLHPNLYYFYSNGKAISQYGLTMGQAVTNPNVRFVPAEKLKSLDVGITNSSHTQGIFHYCRFFLEYNNLDKFEGTITAVGDPKIQVGRTYFDIASQKFGYITEVSKRLTVGDSYTVSFRLKAVRDAVYDEVVSDSGNPDTQEAIGRPSFRKLPEMESFIPRFIDGAVKVNNIPSVQKSSIPPAETPKEFTPLPETRRIVPERKKGSIPLLTPEEQARLDARFNLTHPGQISHPAGIAAGLIPTPVRIFK
jgi:hypothetical protein